jgi:hypothetical protein
MGIHPIIIHINLGGVLKITTAGDSQVAEREPTNNTTDRR